MAYNLHMNENTPAETTPRPRQLLHEKFRGLAKTYCGNSVKPGAITIDTPECFDELCVIMESPLPPKDERAFIVTNQFGWGKGSTIAAAKAKCRANNPNRSGKPYSPTHYYAQLVHVDTTCDGLGSISCLPEYPPINLGQV